MGVYPINALGSPKVVMDLQTVKFVVASGRSGRVAILTNSHTVSQLPSEITSPDSPWQPIHPPCRGTNVETHVAFHAYMLLPGFSIAFHAASLGRSRTSIATYRARAQQAALDNPAVREMINAQLCALRSEDGLQMAQLRGRAQLPHWSILAIAEYRARGLRRRELAAAFRCSRGTIAHALQWKNRGYDFMSGERRLSAAQLTPPGRFLRG